jgi:hypothetical protein
MDQVLAALSARYGHGHDFSRLTDAQRRFLLHPDVKERRRKESLTVKLTHLDGEPDHPLVVLEENYAAPPSHEQFFQDYIVVRNRTYSILTGLASGQRTTFSNQMTYALSDGSRIVVDFKRIDG